MSSPPPDRVDVPSLGSATDGRDPLGYQLRRAQVVGGTLADVFAFFKDPANLERLTPPWLAFRVLDSSTPTVQRDTRIRYRLRLHGVPLRWESRITEFEENQLFADEQLVGPYRRWYHRHLFRSVPGGVHVEDIVDYRLPFGPLGRMVHALAVARQLRAIFDYRAVVMRELFPPESAEG
ncbi:MAG: SRPBCC family protein [Gemmatimonadales bacterium]|nr:SRPBCC family protein [Gemmatimonadales bacterium]